MPGPACGERLAEDPREPRKPFRLNIFGEERMMAEMSSPSADSGETDKPRFLTWADGRGLAMLEPD